MAHLQGVITAGTELNFGYLWDLFKGERYPGLDTTSELKVYPIRDALRAQGIVSDDEIVEHVTCWLRIKHGFAFNVFGPDAKGNGFTPPDFTKSYHNGNVWIYQPREADGSFKDYAYTLVWRVTHELTHALTNPQLDKEYGKGKRQGALGVVTQWQGKDTPPLSLNDAKRAIMWEHHAFKLQRSLMAELGVSVTDDDFAREHSINMVDAVYRVLTGEFSNPGEYGIRPLTRPAGEVTYLALGIIKARAKLLGV